jgi:hypothetical protein
MRKLSTEPKFPTWAPEDVVARWREENRGFEEKKREYDEWLNGIAPTIRDKETRLLAEEDRQEFLSRESGVRDLLFRILTDENMGAVWPELAKVNRKGRLDVPESSVFASCVIRAWHGPHGEETWTPIARGKWLKQVVKLANDLATLLRGTSVDEILPRRYKTEKIKWLLRNAAAAGLASDSRPHQGRLFEWHPGLASETLEDIARLAGHLLRPAILAKPGDSMSRRAYFVRVLADYFRENFGGPRVALITATAAVALEDKTITERQVSRLISLTTDGKSQRKRNRRQ